MMLYKLWAPILIYIITFCPRGVVFSLDLSFYAIESQYTKETGPEINWENGQDWMFTQDQFCTVFGGSDEAKLGLCGKVYDLALDVFDREGYNWLMNQAHRPSQQLRFTQTLSALKARSPNCGASKRTSFPPSAPFPGGALRGGRSNLVKFMTGLIGSMQSMMSADNLAAGNLNIQGSLLTKGLVQFAMGIVIDTIPRFLPPPIWLLMPLPCLPMLTGPNCLGSILYPIAMADFLSADVADAPIASILAGFPSKYASKVGSSSPIRYRICAMAYMGMYCASMFPMCMPPIGVGEGQTFPLCFPVCLVVLVACSGFWIEDIIGPCLNVSFPPVCAFSIFINMPMLPPPITKFEDNNPLPQQCPEPDPLFDFPNPTYEVPPPISVPPLKLLPSMKPRTIDDIDVLPPIKVIHKCDCKHCNAHHGHPIHVLADSKHPEDQYQQGLYPSECCRSCEHRREKIGVRKVSPKKVSIKRHQTNITLIPLTGNDSRGHVMPL